MSVTRKTWSFRIAVAVNAFMLFSGYALGNGFRDAVKAGDIQMVDLLIRTSPELLRETYEDGTTPLHVAVSNRQKAVTELLLDHRPDINARDSTGTTPLLLACEKGFPEIVDLLLRHGADASAQDARGTTPLLKAVNSGNREAAKILLDHAVNAVTADRGEFTGGQSGSPAAGPNGTAEAGVFRFQVPGDGSGPRIVPFLRAGSEPMYFESRGSSDFSLGGGIKHFFSKHLGLRPGFQDRVLFDGSGNHRPHVYPCVGFRF